MITEAFQDFISLIYPNLCIACATSLVKGERFVCTDCILQLPATDHLQEPQNQLWTRLYTRVPVTFAVAFYKFKKKSKVQRILHSLKYRNNPDLGLLLGKVCGEKLKRKYDGTFTEIIPVPLHKSRQQSRGYNQSTMFAMGLAEKLAIPLNENLLARVVKTETQTRKSKLRRWENVDTIFLVPPHQVIPPGAHLLLVDDVVTTGSTLEACAAALFAAGCAKVSVACIAAAQ